MTKANENNFAHIVGTLTGEPSFDHSLYGESFYSAKVMVERMSGVADILPITLPERIFAGDDAAKRTIMPSTTQAETPSTLPVPTGMPLDGCHIDVRGQLRSYNKVGSSGTRLVLSVFAREAVMCDEPVAHINQIELTGFLCKPAVFRTTPFQREIADMLIAVNRAYEKSDYLPCIAWGRNAHFASSVSVGSRLVIRGRLQSREYQKLLPDGSVISRVAYEVSCTSLELV